MFDRVLARGELPAWHGIIAAPQKAGSGNGAFPALPASSSRVSGAASGPAAQLWRSQDPESHVARYKAYGTTGTAPQLAGTEVKQRDIMLPLWLPVEVPNQATTYFQATRLPPIFRAVFSVNTEKGTPIDAGGATFFWPSLELYLNFQHL